jgi:esterase
MKLNYKSFGEGSPLIIMHGLMGMLDNWQAPGKELAVNFKVYIVDLRNHGHSPHSEEHSYDVMVDDVIELMDDLGLESTNFLGHSMGGKVAMKLAQDHPERVLKLVVADIGPRHYKVHHQSIIAGLRAAPLKEIDKRADAEQYLKAHIPQSGVRQFLMKSLFHKERHQFGWRFNLDAIEKNLERIGAAIDEMDYQGETLFIRGSDSDYIQDEDWPDIKLLFPHAYLVTIEGAGHWLHAEKPTEFIAAVNDFLL